MSEIGFTEDQKKAIDTKGCDILVAAAAGSGKTAVLVERIINTILNLNNPVDIDKLLVVTFTDAAATEMKQRISSEIAKKLSVDPFNEHLQKQITLLNKASITTIHSYCLKLIRQNFHLIDVDPTFRISDQTEIGLLKQEVIDELFEEEYDKKDCETFLKLVECFGERIKDSGLQKLVINVHSFIENNPWPKEFIKKSIKSFKLDNNTKIDDTVWVKILKEEIKNTLLGVLEYIKIGEKICKKVDGPIDYLENFHEDKILVDTLLKATNDSFEKLYIFLEDLDFSRLKKIKKDSLVLDELKKEAQDLRDKKIKSEIKKIKKSYFFKSPNEMKNNLIDFYPIMNGLGDLVLKFSDKFKKIKKEKNIVDFNDLEHFALDILLEENSTMENPIKTKKAKEISNFFHEILIDEYQDSNMVQELILFAVSKDNPKNRFMVGDIKQSIYRFRRARPELFINKYNSFSNIFNNDNLKIDLSKNFRSRECVVSSVNYIFYQLMTNQIGEIDYNDNQALYTGATFSPTNQNISNNTELHIIEQEINHNEDSEEDEIDENIEELGNAELEAQVVANRINELIFKEDSIYVEDKNYNIRKAKFKDIVILVRSIKDIGEVFIEELKKYNIPVFANTESGFFNSIEVQTILSYLKIIDNPLQDIDIISVLHSPIYTIKSEELMEIRKTNKKINFFVAIKNYLEKNNNESELAKKLNVFLDDLEKFRQMSVYMPINQLITKVYDETDYYNYVGAFKGGLIRQGNLISLKEKAISYENTSFKSLFHFIKYINKLIATKKDSGNAKILSENEDVVRMMTIHKSKGLEFPIVFVSMLGKKFNLEDEKQSLLLHQDIGFGPNYIDLENRVKSNTIARLAIARKMHKEMLSEELRVLYVALTRAKEKLILTGTTKKLSSNIEKWTSFINYDQLLIPYYYLIKVVNYFDFLVPCIARHKDGEILNFYEHFYKNEMLYNFCTNFCVKLWKQQDVLKFNYEQNLEIKDKHKTLNIIENNRDYSGFKSEISKRLNFTYRYELEKNLPSKIAISEIKRNFLKKIMVEDNIYDNEEIIFASPTFMEEIQPISNIRRGTAIHTVLENIDINNDLTAEKIKLLIENLVNKKILSEEEKKAIPIEKILKFVNSDIAKRMRKGKNLRKEEPFTLGLTPYEIYQEEQYKDSNEVILLHGIIDCYFIEDDKIILIDYKSDYVSKNNIEQVVEKYKFQINIYRKALEKSLNKKVAESIIYFVNIDDYVLC